LDKLSLCNNIDEITKWQSIINALGFRGEDHKVALISIASLIHLHLFLYGFGYNLYGLLESQLNNDELTIKLNDIYTLINEYNNDSDKNESLKIEIKDEISLIKESKELDSLWTN